MRPNCGKVRFKTQENAWAALDRIDAMPRIIGEKRPCRAYRCGHCKGWHLTSTAFKSGRR